VNQNNKNPKAKALDSKTLALNSKTLALDSKTFSDFYPENSEILSILIQTMDYPTTRIIGKNH